MVVRSGWQDLRQRVVALLEWTTEQVLVMVCRRIKLKSVNAGITLSRASWENSETWFWSLSVGEFKSVDTSAILISVTTTLFTIQLTTLCASSPWAFSPRFLSGLRTELHLLFKCIRDLSANLKKIRKSGSFVEKMHENKRIKGLKAFKKSGIPDKSGKL